MIYRVPEGCAAHQGINWNRDKASTLMLFVLLWRCGMYFRIRSPWIVSGNDRAKTWWEKIRYKYTWDFQWDRKTKVGSLEFEFYRNTFRFGDRRLTMEEMQDLFERYGRPVFGVKNVDVCRE
jgi:hypothetical protein